MTSNNPGPDQANDSTSNSNKPAKIAKKMPWLSLVAISVPYLLFGALTGSAINAWSNNALYYLDISRSGFILRTVLMSAATIFVGAVSGAIASVMAKTFTKVLAVIPAGVLSGFIAFVCMSLYNTSDLAQNGLWAVIFCGAGAGAGANFGKGFSPMQVFYVLLGIGTLGVVGGCMLRLIFAGS